MTVMLDEAEELVETIREKTVRGKIIPSERDRHGNVTDIAIKTPDREKYIIFINKTGEKLFRYINRTVEATGTVRERFGEFILTVETYGLLKEDDADE